MRSLGLSAIVLAGATATTVHAGLVSSWIGGPAGNWNVGANWNNGIPGSAGVNDAVISTRRGPVVVTLTTAPSIQTLSIGANCTLTQNNDADIALTGVTNDGLWTMNSGGNATDVYLNDAFVTFGGSGVMSLSNHVNNRIFGINALRTLVNGADHTIRGAGQIGQNNNLDLVNHGEIRADFPTALQLDLTNSIVNDGLLVASSGGSLVLLNSTIDNTNGEIRAESGGAVSLQGAGITNGELVTQGTGSINLTANVSSFSNVHITNTLTQPNDGDVTLNGSVTNDGTWSVSSGGNGTDIYVNNNLTIGGTGTIATSAHLNNRIFGINALRTLVNGANHTIRGGGSIGQNNNLDLVNDGVIRAEGAEMMSLDLTNTCTNNGLLVAGSGGTMRLLNSFFANTQGVIRAEDGGHVSLQGAAIVGGELETEGAGTIGLTTNVSSFSDVHITNTLTQPNDGDVILNGPVTNDATWSMNSTGNGTDIYLNNDLTIGGSGTIATSAHLNNRIYGINALRTLTNGASHTIRGGGSIGQNNNLNLVNEGVIRAEGDEMLSLDLTNTCTNNGLLVAGSGGTMRLLNSAIGNTLGVIRAEDGGHVSLQGAAIVGGELETEGAGTIGLTTNVSSFSDVHIVTTLSQPNDGDVVLDASVTNDGIWSMNSTGNGTDLMVNNDVTIGGGGTIVMSSHANNRLYGINALRTLTNGFQHTIRGGGSIGQNNNLNLTNKGTLIADGTTALQIDVTSVFNNDNTGKLRVTGTGGLTIHAGGFNNFGLFEIDAGRSASRTGSVAQQDGETRINGTLTLSANESVFVTGGLLSGNGVLNGKASVSGGSIAPSSTTSDAADIGTLTINGTYTQSDVGGYVVDIGLTGNDLVDVNAAASLGGALQVRLVDGFVPIAGQSFTILTANSISGTYGCIEYPTVPGGYFHAVYHPTFVELIVDTTPGLPADLNHDGFVNAADLAILLGNWGDAPCGGATCCESDLNGDGEVDAADLAILLGAWG